MSTPFDIPITQPSSGASLRSFQGELADGAYISGSTNPIVWAGLQLKEPSTIGWDGTTFTATADDEGLWYFYMEIVMEGNSNPARTATLYLQNLSPTSSNGIYGTVMTNYSANIIGYTTLNLSGMVQVESGFKYRFRLNGTTTSSLYGNSMRAGGFKI